MTRPAPESPHRDDPMERDVRPRAEVVTSATQSLDGFVADTG